MTNDDELVAEPDFAALEAQVARDREELRAAHKLSSIEAGRRKAGVLGAAMAGAMVTMSELYEGKPPQEDQIEDVVESDKPLTDIEKDGIDMAVDGINVWSPPQQASESDGSSGGIL